MKKKSLIVILVTLVLAIVAGVLLWNNRYLTTLKGDASDFTVNDTANVTKIFIANMNDDDVILKRTSRGWYVNDYLAQQKKVNHLLQTLNRMRIRKPVSIASHDGVVKRMSTAGIKVEVYQTVYRINLFDKIKLFPHEKCTKTFYVGDTTQDNMGTFMLKEGAQRAYIVYIPSFRGFLSSRFTPELEEWRDHNIFNEELANIKSAKIEFYNQPEQGFEVVNTGRHDYKLIKLSTGAEIPFDTIRVLNFLTSFNDIRFEAFLNNMDSTRIDSIIHSPYKHAISLTTLDGKTNKILTFKKYLLYEQTGVLMGDKYQYSPDIDNDRMYGLINNGNDFVLIQNFVFDKLIKPISYYEFGAEPEIIGTGSFRIVQ